MEFTIKMVFNTYRYIYFPPSEVDTMCKINDMEFSNTSKIKAFCALTGRELADAEKLHGRIISAHTEELDKWCVEGFEMQEVVGKKLREFVMHRADMFVCQEFYYRNAKVPFIKYLREAYDWGLREAKTAMDQCWEHMRELGVPIQVPYG